MWRSRLLWFTFGFTSTYAVFCQCVLKDLLVERHALASHVDNNFGALQARLSHIETSSPNRPSAPDQVEG